MNTVKRAITFLLVIVAQFAMAQETKETKPTPPTPQQQANAFVVNHYSKAFALAQRHGDTRNAINALYNVLAEYPQNDSLLYTLSYLYFENNNSAQAVLVSKDLLTVNPEHLGGLEIAAVSYEKLGIKDKALDAYENLYLKSTDYEVLYKVAFLQYDLQRLGECNTNIDILLKHPNADTLKVYYTDANSEEKEYAIKVALYNLKGMVSTAKGDKKSAKQYYEAALAIAPDFVLAKENLAALGK